MFAWVYLYFFLKMHFYCTGVPKMMSLFLPVSTVKAQLLSWWLRGISKWGSILSWWLPALGLYYLISLLKNMQTSRCDPLLLFSCILKINKSLVNEMDSCTAYKLISKCTNTLVWGNTVAWRKSDPAIQFYCSLKGKSLLPRCITELWYHT